MSSSFIMRSRDTRIARRNLGSSGIYSMAHIDSNSMKAKNRITEEKAMTECFSKLQKLVPNVGTAQKLSQVQLLQHVIDYILELESELDYPPAPLLLPSPHSLCSAERRPLAEQNCITSVTDHFGHMELVEDRPVS